ncbi:type VI secretion system tip protein VgrG [Hymenobacter sp. BT175]|uniref:type VI secretion system tip protein VgrG n=1 Tax=Hymenobacter translucens TaxID=2886507 RepID=UPI001D0EDE69|nr:type VI secretion system tip protein VgrG [Hymenobacter translucens]MCC2545350.1 type VI secretion system tip protein VgrG [Hymenobacter translucens]
MPANPLTGKTDLVTFRILVNGTEIDSTYPVVSIEVSKGVNRISSARIEILDGDPSSEDFPISDSADFLPGTELSILAGYHTEDTLIFKGIVVKHGLRVSPDLAPVLVVECRDAAAKLTVGRKSALFEKSTDDAAISSIIGTYSGVSSTVDATTVTHDELVQFYSSDWDFIVARAEANGLVVLNDQGKVTVTAPDTSANPVLELTYGTNLTSFAVEMDARSQYAAVKGQAWSAKDQALVEAEGASPGVSTPGNVTPATLAAVMGAASVDLPATAATSQESLQAWTKALRLKSELAKVRGTIRFQGSALAVPGSMVSMLGMGQRFNGNAYVSGVTHTLAEGDWTTEISLGLDEQWFAQQTPDVSAPASNLGQLPGVQGLYNAVVTKITEDPGNEFRVQVKVPALQSKNLWARLGHPYASSGFGTFFYPEVNDEVVLGFFNNDPQQPVVLGALYSSGRAPAYTPDDKNSIKAHVTQSKLTVEFNDDKKILTLKTPGNNKIVLSDDGKSITITDQSSNKVELSSSGIVLESASNLQIKAKGNLDLEATGNLTVKATGDLALQGLNVAGTAQIQMKMAGTASAELSASGQVTVQGAMVMIN